VISPVNDAVAAASLLTCLQLPTPYALTRSGDYGGQIQRGISRSRAFFVPAPTLTFWPFVKLPHRTSPPEGDFGYGSRGFSSFFALQTSQVPRCNPIATPWQRTVRWALLWSAPLMFGSVDGARKLPHSLAGLDLRRRYRAPLCQMSAPLLLCHIPGARSLDMSFNSTIGFSMCLKSSGLQRGLLRGGTCGWKSPVYGRELLEIDMGV
jgi:hypothetical protein